MLENNGNEEKVKKSNVIDENGEEDTFLLKIADFLKKKNKDLIKDSSSENISSPVQPVTIKKVHHVNDFRKKAIQKQLVPDQKHNYKKLINFEIGEQEIFITPENSEKKDQNKNLIEILKLLLKVNTFVNKNSKDVYNNNFGLANCIALSKLIPVSEFNKVDSEFFDIDKKLCSKDSCSSDFKQRVLSMFTSNIFNEVLFRLKFIQGKLLKDEELNEYKIVSLIYHRKISNLSCYKLIEISSIQFRKLGYILKNFDLDPINFFSDSAFQNNSEHRNAKNTEDSQKLPSPNKIKPISGLKSHFDEQQNSLQSNFSKNSDQILVTRDDQNILEN